MIVNHSGCHSGFSGSQMGYAVLLTEGGRAVRCSDDDPIHTGGDPRVVLDLAGGTMRIDDGARWSVGLRRATDH